jgi:starch-binding outer membrane protein, SusD/RagB family
MNNKIFKKIIFLLTVVLLTVTCSEEFLTKRPAGSLEPLAMQNVEGIENLIVGAYSYLCPPLYGWGKDPDNWTFGSIMGGDAYKGTEAGDQPDINPLMQYEVTSGNSSYLGDKWNANYNGIFRCNDVIAIIDAAPVKEALTMEFKHQKKAEARFLRGFYYFELVKVFGPMVPYLDEQIIVNKISNPKVANDVSVWSKIEADFQFAADSLPATWSEAGRANSWAAKAYLAKAYLYERKFSDALPIFTEVIADGVTASGDKYGLLDNYDDNFNYAFDNSKESVFAQQNTVSDGTQAHNNPGMSLNYAYGGGPGGCCGFFQPSVTMANSFKVDGSGLPFLDESYNDVDLKNDDGIVSADPFTPDNTTPVDPRIDWTMGRRGIQYLNWGVMPGNQWIRDQQYGGPYIPMKNVFRDGDPNEMMDGWAPGGANNFTLMRFADVLLMAAECEAEVGSLATATDYVNQVRARARDGRWVASVANYQIEEYPADFADIPTARLAIRFERKIELSQEGHRFFDLRRYDDTQTIMADQLNAYITHESARRQQFGGKHFDVPCDVYCPIPVAQIELAGGVVTQLDNGCVY